jgi:hypothetical protein
MKRITTLHVEGHAFEIVYYKNYYCAIDHKYIDDDGRLTQQLNGLQTFASKTKQECIDRACKYIQIEQMQNEGFTFEDAFKQVYNL